MDVSERKNYVANSLPCHNERMLQQDMSAIWVGEKKLPNLVHKSFQLNFHSLSTERVIGISGSLIWSKTLMELIFNPCDEFRWSPESPVSQTLSPYLHIGVPGTFSDFLRSVQMLKREWDGESNGKLLHLSIPSTTAASVCGGRPVFEQNCSLGSWVCSEGSALEQNTLMMVILQSYHKWSL